MSGDSASISTDTAAPIGEKRAAVFYDVDGTLVNSNVITAYLYYAMRLPKLSERMRRLSRAAAMAPIYAAAELTNRGLFNRLFYANYKGIPHERLRLMGREAAEKAFLPNMYREARKRVRKARDMGLTQVIVSGALDMIMEPFAKEVGIDYVLANRLEFANDKATGKLIPPILAGDEKKKAVERFARQHNIDLSQSYAYGDSLADIPMLETVGFPCVVNPGDELAKLAGERAWPVLHFA